MAAMTIITLVMLIPPLMVLKSRGFGAQFWASLALTLLAQTLAICHAIYIWRQHHTTSGHHHQNTLTRA